MTLQNKTNLFKNTKHLFLPIFLFLLLYKAEVSLPELNHHKRCHITFKQVSDTQRNRNPSNSVSFYLKFEVLFFSIS